MRDDKELLARWDDYVESVGSVMGGVEYMAQQMRDRIEALTKGRDEAWKRAAHSEKMWGEAEVKLSKAIRALKESVREFDCPIARATLAEIKGDKDNGTT